MFWGFWDSFSYKKFSYKETFETWNQFENYNSFLKLNQPENEMTFSEKKIHDAGNLSNHHENIFTEIRQ